jgi:hypothetical protein
LVQDRDERLCFVEHFLGPQASLRNFQIGRYPEQSDFHAAAYDPMRAEPDAEGNFIVRLARDGIVAEGRHGRLVRVLKTYRFHRSETRLDVSYEVQNRYREPIHLRFGVELNLNLDSARTSAQWLEIDGQSRHALDQAGERARVGRVLWRDEARELQWSVTAEPSAHLWFHPIEIPRPSADGLTGSFQGTCLFFSRPLDLWGEERMTWDFRFVLERLRAS